MPNQTKPSQDRLVESEFSDAKAYAALYGGSTPTARFFSERLQHVLEFLRPLKGGKVLDVGCGPGILLTRLASLNGCQFELFGVDRSLEMITEARALTGGLAVNWEVGRLEELPFLAESFDVILAMGVLEYLPELEAGLREIARVAKPDALILVSMLNRLSMYRWWEKWIYRYWRAFWSLVRGRRVKPLPTLWLYSEKPLRRMMKACQLECLEAVYYDVNICVPPFDSEYPNRAFALNHWASVYFGRRLRSLVHTGFILKARKNG